MRVKQDTKNITLESYDLNNCNCLNKISDIMESLYYYNLKNDISTNSQIHILHNYESLIGFCITRFIDPKTLFTSSTQLHEIHHDICKSERILYIQDLIIDENNKDNKIIYELIKYIKKKYKNYHIIVLPDEDNIDFWYNGNDFVNIIAWKKNSPYLGYISKNPFLYSEELLRKICSLLQENMKPTEVQKVLNLNEKRYATLINNIKKRKVHKNISKDYNF